MRRWNDPSGPLGMSLYKKIIWLFIGVAILPLLIFAAYARQQTLQLVDRAATAELLSTAAAASEVLAQEADVAEAALRGFAAMQASDFTPELLERVLRSGAGPQPDGFSSLALVGEGREIMRAGEVDADLICEAGMQSRLVRVEVEAGTGLSLVGTYRPGHVPSFRDTDGVWVYDAVGELVVAASCSGGPGLPIGWRSTEAGAPRLAPTATGDASERVALAAVPDRGWTVVTTGTDGLSGSVAGFFRAYWLFVLSLATSTLLAFSVFLRPVTSALDDLTRAAERVAGGDFSPWVPTPRDDEIGRLTHAFHDMTERLRDMVAQVERSGRLAVLGKLSAYLAHEIRNPLSAVQMNLQRLQRWQRTGDIPDRCGQPIEISLKEVGRLSAAVSNVLQLSPSRKRPAQPVALHHLLTEVGELLATDFRRHDIALRWELDAESDRVLAEPGQLKGVFINLMLNAIDVQPDGGELLVRTTLEADSGVGQGPHVHVRFRDRGPGVAPELSARIFEPFFTTKASGSGIGLAVASQTLRDHGGDIRLEFPAEGPTGAVFLITLPLAAVVASGVSDEQTPRMASWLEDAAGPGSDGSPDRVAAGRNPSD